MKSLKYLNTVCKLPVQPGYIVLIVGAALLISGIVVSTLWAVPFASKILREDTILGGVSVKPAS